MSKASRRLRLLRYTQSYPQAFYYRAPTKIGRFIFLAFSKKIFKSYSQSNFVN
jgi:hypothetical protein